MDQIVKFWLSLRYLGATIKGLAIIFGDNKCVVTSSFCPELPLKKRHNLLAYHCVCKAVASGMINSVYIYLENKVADVLTKHVGWPQLWPIIQPILFWRGIPKDVGGNDKV